MARAAARIIIALSLLAVILAIAPSAAASLDVFPSNFNLGKIDPGHTGTHFVNVTNTGSAAVQIQTDVQCGCTDYLTIEPSSFPLESTEKKQVRITVQVAADADPGIHDYTIRFVEQAVSGAGGTAQGAFGLGFQFEVRTAGLFITYLDANKDPIFDLRDDGSLGFRFVSGFESELDVTVTGTVVEGGEQRHIGPVSFTAPAAGASSAVANERIQTGLTADSAAGVYNVTLSATWSDPDTGRTGPSIRSVTIPIGAAVTVKDFEARKDGDDIVFSGTLVNEGGTAVEVQMVVEVTETGRPDVARFTSEAIELAPGEERAVTARWEDATGAVYRATAYASFKVAGDPSGTTTTGQRTAEEVFEVEGERTDDEKADGGGTGTILIAALVGVVIGGVVAYFAVRKKR